jgi:hypothetical protein
MTHNPMLNSLIDLLKQYAPNKNHCEITRLAIRAINAKPTSIITINSKLILVKKRNNEYVIKGGEHHV